MAKTSLKATGKLPTYSTGSTKWLKILAIGNFYIDQWSNESGVDWNDLYDPAYLVGTITATNTIDLDDDVRKISQQPGDSVRVVTTAGQTTEYEFVNANRLYEYDTGFYVTKVGRTLRFNKAFKTTDPQFGAKLYIPAYLYPDKLVNESDEVPVPDPNWLVLITAAEYVRSDITRQNQYPNLIGEANEAMKRMIEDNDGQSSELYKPWNPISRLEW